MSCELQAEAKAARLLEETDQASKTRLLATARRESVQHLTRFGARDASGSRVTAYCTFP